MVSSEEITRTTIANTKESTTVVYMPKQLATGQEIEDDATNGSTNNNTMIMHDASQVKDTGDSAAEDSSPILKMPYDVVFKIFNATGSTSAICLSLTCRQLYAWFKTTYPKPLKLGFCAHMTLRNKPKPYNEDSITCDRFGCPTLLHRLKSWVGPDYHIGLYGELGVYQFLKTSVYGKGGKQNVATSGRFTFYKPDYERSVLSIPKIQLLIERYEDWSNSARLNRSGMFKLFAATVPLDPMLPSPFSMGEYWYVLAWELIRQELYKAENLLEEVKFWSSFHIVKRRKDDFSDMVAEVRWDIGLKAMQLLEL